MILCAVALLCSSALRVIVDLPKLSARFVLLSVFFFIRKLMSKLLNTLSSLLQDVVVSCLISEKLQSNICIVLCFVVFGPPSIHLRFYLNLVWTKICTL